MPNLRPGPNSGLKLVSLLSFARRYDRAFFTVFTERSVVLVSQQTLLYSFAMRFKLDGVCVSHTSLDI